MKTATRENLTLFFVGASFVVVMPLAMLQKPRPSGLSNRTAIERAQRAGDVRTASAANADFDALEHDLARE